MNKPNEKFLALYKAFRQKYKKLTLYYLISSAEMGEDCHDDFWDAEKESVEAAVAFLEKNKLTYQPSSDCFRMP